MRALLQRVKKASVSIDKKIYSEIETGFLVFLGIENSDTEDDIEWLVQKILKIRLFDDANGVMNENIQQINGAILVVSQFTLQANTKKGTRPSYIKAAKPEISIPLYEKFIKRLEQSHSKQVKTGVFGADMKVGLVNDGPVTIWLDSKNKSY